jgi:ABC-type Zn uptake system ZnuABC Zn-binding protein ZnuA
LSHRLRPRFLLLALAVLSVGAFVIAGCGGSDSSSEDEGTQIDVLATTTQIGDWVREVGGDSVDVHQILQPNTDPHDYEPRPSDVEAAVDAQLVFANGDELDHWIEEVVSESGSDAEVVDLATIVPIQLPGEGEAEHAEEEHAEGEEKHGEEEHHHDSKHDPHWWHDPRNAEAAVREIERRLIAADPSAKSEIEANADAYLAQLRAMDTKIAACIDAVPAQERKLVTDHDAFGYFANRYGIEVVGAVIPSQTTQAQPSAKELSELADTIEEENVQAVFPESSLSPSVAEAIARQTGASADYTLYGDTLGPADSPGGTYVGMEEANADAVVRGFTGGEERCE